jgi:hypothetical protein
MSKTQGEDDDDGDVGGIEVKVIRNLKDGGREKFGISNVLVNLTFLCGCF